MRLTTDAAQHPGVFAAVSNSGDPDAVEQVYEDVGLVVPEPGRPMTGPDRAAANAAFQALGVPTEVTPQRSHPGTSTSPTTSRC